MNNQNQTYAVVDLEATGTGSTARIIQVGIVLVRERQIIKTYATDVNPHQALDERISELTGITDDQLKKAPTFGQVARTIYDLLADAVFVAHNVYFDANLLAEQLFMEGFDLKTPRIDTVELAQVCYPTLDKYSLSFLCEQLGIVLSDAHTAIADALATAQLFLKIQERLEQLPTVTLRNLDRLADHLLYETGELIKQAKGQDVLAPVWQEVGGLILRRPQIPTRGRQVPEWSQALADLGLVERPQQTAFSAVITEHYELSQPTFIEAAAGLGKTYGYLLPLLGQEGSEQLLVAVPTKLLQDQILAQEGKALTAVYGTSFASLKASRHYLDLDRFVHQLFKSEANRLLNRYKMQLLVWLLETETGDLDEIRQKRGQEAYFEQLGQTGCLSATSLFSSVAFWERALARAQTSQVLVTNHAFLLASWRDGSNWLARRVLVVDEAQRFFLAMEANSRARVNMTNQLLTIRQLLNQERQLPKRRLLECLQQDLSELVSSYYEQRAEQIEPHILERLRLHLLELDAPELRGLTALISGEFSEFWLETQFLSGRRQTDLVGARIDFASLSPYLEELKKAYFISATIDISKRIKLPDLLGLTAYETVTFGQAVSDQQVIFLDEDMPALESSSYQQALLGRLVMLADLGIPIVVLLTSKQALLALSEALDELAIGHLAQGRHGDPGQMKRRFDKGEQLILLGTGSFWEGADFSQQDQLILVIPRLPFDNPKDKFIKKINRYLIGQGKQPFYDYALPVAGLRLKQALGRVKRSSHQHSVVVILDHRLLTKPYGKTLIRGMAVLAPVRQEKFSQILLELPDFCYNEKTDKRK